MALAVMAVMLVTVILTMEDIWANGQVLLAQVMAMVQVKVVMAKSLR